MRDALDGGHHAADHPYDHGSARAIDPNERMAQLSRNLQAVRARIAAAARAAGRDLGEVDLVAVTKTYPAADVLRLARLGVLDIGENRDQEAAAKAAEVRTAARQPGAGSLTGIRWHFVGRLQRNKCRSVVRYADVVHSVDSLALAGTLGEQAARHRSGRPLDVLVQVSLDGDATRGGVVARELDRVIFAVAEQPSLRLRGVMAVAPMDWAPTAAFAQLQEIAERVRRDHPDAGWISAGMSDDLEAAVAFGSTHVRLGSALLGKRPALG